MLSVLSETFSPREELLEQMIISKESKISFEYLDTMDYLLYDTDFKHAYIFSSASYAYANEKAMKDTPGKNPRHPAAPTDSAQRVLDIESMFSNMPQ